MRQESNFANSHTDPKEEIQRSVEKTVGAGKEAASQIIDRAKTFASEVQDGVDGAVASLGSRAREAADSVRAHTPTHLGHAGEKVAKAIDQSGQYLEDKGASGIAKDASKLIKKYPLTSLFLGFGAGLLIARKLSR